MTPALKIHVYRLSIFLIREERVWFRKMPNLGLTCKPPAFRRKAQWFRSPAPSAVQLRSSSRSGWRVMPHQEGEVRTYGAELNCVLFVLLFKLNRFYTRKTTFMSELAVGV